MFDRFALDERVLAVLTAKGFITPTPVQEATLPHTLAGRDALAQARTGTGKTLAFALPIAQRLEPSAARGRAPRALALAPTRELALQVADEIGWVAPTLDVVTVYGGTGYGRQAGALKRGCDVVVATPGRASDYLRQGLLRLDEVQIVVLDEADEMLSMGFEEELEQLLAATPSTRQTLLFSATLPSWAKRLAEEQLVDPVRVNVTGDDAIRYRELALEVPHAARSEVLSHVLFVHGEGRAIVFTHTKAEVDTLLAQLSAQGHRAEAVHGDVSQTERERAVGRFRQGQADVLVGTNVAARGLDIPEVELVVHYRLPSEPSVYQHRSGRTGRAGREGTVMVLYTSRERRALALLERQLGRRFERTALPAPQAVQEAKVARLLKDLASQPARDKDAWRELAERWVESKNVDAVAALLARTLGGAPAPRSLLTGEEGWQTLKLTERVTSVAQALRVLKDAGAGDVGRMQMAKSGVYVDLRPQDAEALSARLELAPVTQLSDALPSGPPRPRRPHRAGRSVERHA